ncbi:iron-sulfur cluster assembly accessory protein [Gammaproteobacteria bacterium]|nr:iron-sulfur cluster assembly accessory protein [Gammaproteobacteria bacterium]
MPSDTQIQSNTEIKTLLFTPAAGEKIFTILSEQSLPFFRIKIQGGGCMGFEFVFGLDETQSARDFCWQANTVLGDFSYVIDHISYSYLKGATIDFISDANGERFIVKSQYAQTCSCNKSFSIENTHGDG